jgi:hypothetical protein
LHQFFTAFLTSSLSPRPLAHFTEDWTFSYMNRDATEL